MKDDRSNRSERPQFNEQSHFNCILPHCIFKLWMVDIYWKTKTDAVIDCLFANKFLGKRFDFNLFQIYIRTTFHPNYSVDEGGVNASSIANIVTAWRECDRYHIMKWLFEGGKCKLIQTSIFMGVYTYLCFNIDVWFLLVVVSSSLDIFFWLWICCFCCCRYLSRVAPLLLVTAMRPSCRTKGL